MDHKRTTVYGRCEGCLGYEGWHLYADGVTYQGCSDPDCEGSGALIWWDDIEQLAYAADVARDA